MFNPSNLSVSVGSGFIMPVSGTKIIHMVWNSLTSQTYHVLCTSLNDLIEFYNYNTNSDKTELGTWTQNLFNFIEWTT